jgi:hypothetical protein
VKEAAISLLIHCSQFSKYVSFGATRFYSQQEVPSSDIGWDTNYPD